MYVLTAWNENTEGNLAAVLLPRNSLSIINKALTC